MFNMSKRLFISWLNGFPFFFFFFLCPFVVGVLLNAFKRGKYGQKTHLNYQDVP